MFYSIIILHWTLNTTNYLRPKGRSFWKKRWRLSDTSVCFIWIWKPEVCVGVIGRSPRGVASTIEWEQHYPEYFHLQRLANVQLLPPVKRKLSIYYHSANLREFWERRIEEKQMETQMDTCTSRLHPASQRHFRPCCQVCLTSPWKGNGHLNFRKSTFRFAQA